MSILKIIFLFPITLVLLLHLSTPTVSANPEDHSFIVQSTLLSHKGLIHEERAHVIYSIPLIQIADYFQGYCHARQKKRSFEDEIVCLAQGAFESKKTTRTEYTDPSIFFRGLQESNKYTYILTNDRIQFTAIYDCPDASTCRASKHLFLSNQAKMVRLAGEFTLYPDKDKIMIVFDNASGNYKPSNEQLYPIVKLMNENLHPDDAHIQFLCLPRGYSANPILSSLARSLIRIK